MSTLGDDVGGKAMGIVADSTKLGIELVLKLIDKIFQQWSYENRNQRLQYKMLKQEHKQQEQLQKAEKAKKQFDTKSGWYQNHRKLVEAGVDLTPIKIKLTKAEMQQLSELCMEENILIAGIEDLRDKYINDAKSYWLEVRTNDLERFSQLYDVVINQKRVQALENQISPIRKEISELEKIAEQIETTKQHILEKNKISEGEIDIVLANNELQLNEEEIKFINKFNGLDPGYSISDNVNRTLQDLSEQINEKRMLIGELEQEVNILCNSDNKLFNDEQKQNIINKTIGNEIDTNTNGMTSMEKALNRNTNRQNNIEKFRYIVIPDQPNTYVECFSKKAYQNNPTGSHPYIKTDYKVYKDGKKVLETSDARQDLWTRRQSSENWTKIKNDILKATEVDKDTPTFILPDYRAFQEYLQNIQTKNKSQDSKELTITIDKDKIFRVEDGTEIVANELTLANAKQINDLKIEDIERELNKVKETITIEKAKLIVADPQSSEYLNLTHTISENEKRLNELAKEKLTRTKLAVTLVAAESYQQIVEQPLSKESDFSLELQHQLDEMREELASYEDKSSTEYFEKETKYYTQIEEAYKGEAAAVREQILTMDKTDSIVKDISKIQKDIDIKLPNKGDISPTR